MLSRCNLTWCLFYYKKHFCASQNIVRENSFSSPGKFSLAASVRGKASSLLHFLLSHFCHQVGKHNFVFIQLRAAWRADSLHFNFVCFECFTLRLLSINNNCLLSGKLSLLSAVEMESWKSENPENKCKGRRNLILFVKCSVMKSHEKWNALFQR